MKRTSLILTTLVLASLLLAACGGQETSTSAPGTNVPPVTVQPTGTDMPANTATPQTSGTADLTTTPNVPVTGDDSPNRLSNLMDYEVLDQNGDQIGDVNDMVLDFDNSTIAYVVAGAGGFLGLGEKDVLIPWKMLQLQTSDQTAFVFSGNQDAYKNFPDIDLSTLLPGTGQPAGNWDATIKRYWQNGGTGSANGQATNTPESGADMTATPGATATPGTQKMQGVILASDLLGSTIQTFNSDAQGSNGQSQGNGTVTPAAAQATASSAGNDTGSAGTGIDTSKSLGTMDMTVDDVIVDPNSGEIQYLVVTGAFTDGQRTLAVPVKHLQWDAANQKYSLGVNTLALVNAPAFEDGQYPDFSSKDWSDQLNQYWDNLKSNMLITPVP